MLLPESHPESTMESVSLEMQNQKQHRSIRELSCSRNLTSLETRPRVDNLVWNLGVMEEAYLILAHLLLMGIFSDLLHCTRENLSRPYFFRSISNSHPTPTPTPSSSPRMYDSNFYISNLKIQTHLKPCCVIQTSRKARLLSNKGRTSPIPVWGNMLSSPANTLNIRILHPIHSSQESQRQDTQSEFPGLWISSFEGRSPCYIHILPLHCPTFGEDFQCFFLAGKRGHEAKATPASNLASMESFPWFLLLGAYQRHLKCRCTKAKDILGRYTNYNRHLLPIAHYPLPESYGMATRGRMDTVKQ